MDDNSNTPAWIVATVSSIITLCTAGYALMKFWKSTKTVVREERSEDTKAEDEAARLASARRTEERRNAADEAWQVVDRLTKEVEKQEKRIEAIGKKCDEEIEASREREDAANKRATKCETEHSATRAVLRVVLAWAKNKKMPIPEGLEDLIADERPTATPPSGSAVHRILDPNGSSDSV